MDLTVSPPLVAAALWVVAAAGVAMLPMRRQLWPGLALLATAPLLLVWIGWTQGAGWAAVGLAGFLSMFRRPLLHLVRRASGRAPGRASGRPEQQGVSGQGAAWRSR